MRTLNVVTRNITNIANNNWQTIGVPMEAELGEYTLDGEQGCSYVFACPKTGRKFLNFKTEVGAYEFKKLRLARTSDFKTESKSSELAKVLFELSNEDFDSDNPPPYWLTPMPAAILTNGDICHSTLVSTEIEYSVPGKFMAFTQKFRVKRTKLFAELTYYVYFGSNQIGLDVLIGNSDPSQSDYIEDLAEVFLGFSSQFLPIIDNDIATSNFAIEPWQNGMLKRTLFEGWLGNGQMPSFTGAVFLPNSATEEEYRNVMSYFSEPLEALCLDWKELGPFNWLPAKASELSGGRGAFIEEFKKYIEWNGTTGDIFRDFYMGMGKRPAQTGDHEEYGLMKGQKLLLRGAGAPEHVAEIKRASIYNALRPIHHRELDVSRVTIEKHPDCYFWSGVPHYISWKEGWDTLGKAQGNNAFREGIEPHDSSHGNFLYSPLAYVLTGRIVHRTLCYDHAEAIRFERRYGESKHPGLLGLGEARAARAEGSMAYIYWAVRSPEYRDFLVGRLGQIVDNVELVHAEHEVYPLHVHGEDNRKLDGKYPFTMPWQWGEAICWIAAAIKMCEGHENFDTISERVNAMLKRTAESWVATGWWLHESGRWAIGDAVRWMEDGSALPESAYSIGSGQVAPHFPGTEFDLWNMGALYLVKTLLLDQNSKLYGKAQAAYLYLKQYFAEQSKTGFPRLFDFNPWY